MLNGLDLFSGIGGISIALRPWVRPIAYCENDRWAQACLLSRMYDGSLPNAPIWDDVATLSKNELYEVAIDIVYGGFPCQPYSSAARARNKPDFIVRHFQRLIEEVHPKFVFAENTQRKAVEIIASHCEKLGYKTDVLGTEAAAVGAPFIGRRYWALATANGHSQPTLPLNEQMGIVPTPPEVSSWTTAKARDVRMADGLPYRMDRLRGCGNAVVPAQAREAFMRLMGIHEPETTS